MYHQDAAQWSWVPAKDILDNTFNAVFHPESRSQDPLFSWCIWALENVNVSSFSQLLGNKNLSIFLATQVFVQSVETGHLAVQPLQAPSDHCILPKMQHLKFSHTATLLCFLYSSDLRHWCLPTKP